VARAATILGATLLLVARIATAHVHSSPAPVLGAAFAAYDAGDLAGAQKQLDALDDAELVNRDYALWLRGMVALKQGDAKAARAHFTALGKISGSRFAREVPWRLADCDWAAGNHREAAAAYAKLVAEKDAAEVADTGTARWRIATALDEAHGSARSPGGGADAVIAAYHAMLVEDPAHPLAPRAEARIAELGGAPLSPADRVERAQRLTDEHLWDEAVAELSKIDGATPDVARQRDYWLGTTLFKMRRRYGDAGKLLLGVAPKLGSGAAEAMFHGARALSRADEDDAAIGWYVKVVAAYPHTGYAQEAQFLAGWLEFNRGHYREALAPLKKSLEVYPTSKFAPDALWFSALSHYFLGENEAAKRQLTELAAKGGALEGGKGTYWLARIDEKLADKRGAIAGYTETVSRFPFSWYALLARSRLAVLGSPVDPFGVATPGGGTARPKGPKLAATVDEALASDPLIARADELLAAGLATEAGDELARGEKAFLARRDKSAAFAMLLDRYRKAGNAFRPWMLAVSYCGSALDGPASGDAKRWWENAYPRAYRDLVEKYQALGANPEGYLYSIMRKESGFNPHDLSYADAQGLLQMIPPTTQRVAKELGIPYDPGRLYEPAYNIQTGSWYIGHLLQKFKGQIPIGAGSFNSGPKPVMKWLDTNGDREIDELVELVPYTQTREYMKKVTENYARYRYLYGGEIYEQPLQVDKHYLDDRLTY
jgi:soluble lytic murein transglycosylase